MATPSVGGALSAVFNWQNAITIGIDILLFAWMHFTPEGMIFGAGVAENLGFVEPVAAGSELAEVVTSTGEAAYAI